MIDYLVKDGITHGLDMYTSAKRSFIDNFYNIILKDRDLDYKIQFCGSTGANAVEAALKLARKVKKRSGIFSFMGAFHGMSLGALSATSNSECREGAGLELNNVTFIPHPSMFKNEFDTIEYINAILNDSHSGISKPAAIILETIQAEGGINVVSEEWLVRLANVCKEEDILLICDEIQVGCGRTGTFFSFEDTGIKPDIVVLSKSISGYGLPMSILLMEPSLDIWKPAEHNGTFRGNQLAFVGARAALEYWKDDQFVKELKEKEKFITEFFINKIQTISLKIKIRGRGMIWGIDLTDYCTPEQAKLITLECYNNGLIIERCGRKDLVIKILPALTIDMELLEEGLRILQKSLKIINKE
ncbi:diaminobutyrate--2-oxoglutarate transaminase [Clostridium botulinum]|uniref:diaminobutyrate--2-oxoglutarate transaminase n=1 Tax=Clostridium botulinum TaxID=1491 RepID=UPI00325FAD71